MKICFFIGDIEKSGGTERVTTLIANRLSDAGYDICILSYKNGDRSFFEINEKIKLQSLHLEKYSGYITRKIMPYIKIIEYCKEKYDFIINVDVILALYTIPVKHIIKSKIISWEHFNYKVNNGVKNRDRARKLSSKKADGIIVLTKADKANYENNLKLKCPIYNIYNPIVGEINNCGNKENIFIAAGRLSYQKNFEELIDIWNIVEKNCKNNNWKLLICGTGENESLLKEKIDYYKLKNVEMPGFCKNVGEYYSKSKVYLMTSRYEGFPMVLLEAQQNSLPIISYDCDTGPSEIVIDNYNGFLINFGDKEEFANKIIWCMENDEKLNKLKDNSISNVNNYNIDIIIKDWYKVFNEIKNN